MNLKSKPYKNLDDSAVQGIARFYDAGKDDAMNNVRRPGLSSSTDLSEAAAVDSTYEWEYQGWRVDICNGKIFKVTSDGTTTEITGATLEIGTPASFADFGASLYIANGKKIVRWLATDTTCAYLTDPDAPATVSHIGFIDQYLLALDTTTDTIKFSEVGDPTDWPGEFFSVEALPDKTKAMHIYLREVAAFGTGTVEFVGDTGNTTLPFQRYEGGITGRGTIAPYSIQQVDNTYFFLDNERKVVRLVGRDPQVISNPFDSDFQALNSVEDARSMHILTGGDTWYVLTFPTDQKTYAYDYKRDVWSEWSYWNNGLREHFIGNCSCYMRSWNKHFVGSRNADGLVFECSKSVYQDNGEVCNWEIWSGWEGNGQWRKVKELILKLKRGKGAALTTPEPWMEVYYRNSDADPGDSDSSWVGPRIVNLGQLGETDQLFRLRQLGRYRQRQYRFVCSGNVPIVLMEAAEL